MLEGGLTYDPFDFLVGAGIAALFHGVIKIDFMARMLVTVLAVAILWAIFLAPDGPTQVVEHLVAQLGDHASSGLLAGMAIAKMTLALFDAVQPSQPRRRRRK